MTEFLKLKNLIINNCELMLKLSINLSRGTNFMDTKKNVFITADFNRDDFDCEAIDRYDFACERLDPKDYDYPTLKEWRKDNISIQDDEAGEKYQEAFDEWAEENLDFEETHQVPMMNCLRYYPSFIDFKEEDRHKVHGATTLLYDGQREAWAVGMTGGGMDLAPHLLATFINLGKGVPYELAQSIKRNWSAYVEKAEHLENCELLAQAWKDEAMRSAQRAQELSGDDRSG